MGPKDQSSDARTTRPAESVLVRLETELQEANDRWMRTAADLDNYRKRFESELERLRSAERESVLVEWLAVADSLERALAAIEDKENPWTQGMRALFDQIQGVLKKFGARRIYPKGEPFNPRYHEAVATVPSLSESEGIVAEVVQTGYTMGDRVLRPARVITVR